MTIPYFGNVNPDLLGLTPVGAGRVLEIGCGEGALANAYKARSPRTHYTAVEVHGPAADMAERVVDRLLRGDFETMAEEAVTEGTPFDVIVMGDVLEHMRDPEATLARLNRLLADDGHLVLSVPNVNHWTALFHLFQGDWPTADSGLFDRTHLRFFTFTSLRRSLEQAGFRVLKRRPRNFPLDKAMADRWVPALADFAQAMGIDRAGFLERASALQYIAVAQKAARPAPAAMQIHFSAYAPAALEARTHLPMTYLFSLPELAVSYLEKKIHLPSLGRDRPKLLIVQRMRFNDAAGWREVLARAIRESWLVVTECDDHPDLMASINEREGDADRWIAYEQTHAVQTSTDALAEVFRAHNPEVRAFPNTAFTLPPLAPRPMRPPTIFFGALNREGFSGQVARSLAPVIARHPDALFEVVHDRAFFDGLPTANKRFRPAMGYADFLDAMGACDIVLAPLEGAPAELFKSDIKYVEAASRGVAMIASPPVYAATIRDGETGVIAPAVPDWSPALDRLLSAPAERDRIARAAWEDVRDARMFADQARIRRDWYLDLWERREALTAGLIARVPGLAEALA